MKRRREPEPRVFAGRMHDVRGQFGAIISICCEGPGCHYCDVEVRIARKRAAQPDPAKEEQMELNWKPNTGQSIDALYAWVATEPDGGEGVCSMQLGSVHFPMVGADIDRMKSLRGYAEAVRRATGYPVRLVRYSMREDLEALP